MTEGARLSYEALRGGQQVDRCWWLRAMPDNVHASMPPHHPSVCLYSSKKVVSAVAFFVFALTGSSRRPAAPLELRMETTPPGGKRC
jgi:hypothetical protein